MKFKPLPYELLFIFAYDNSYTRYFLSKVFCIPFQPSRLSSVRILSNCSKIEITSSVAVVDLLVIPETLFSYKPVCPSEKVLTVCIVFSGCNEFSKLSCASFRFTTSSCTSPQTTTSTRLAGRVVQQQVRGATTRTVPHTSHPLQRRPRDVGGLLSLLRRRSLQPITIHRSVTWLVHDWSQVGGHR